MSNNILKTAKDNYESIQNNFKLLNSLGMKNVELITAADWLLDNIYLVQKSYNIAINGLSLKYINKLRDKEDNSIRDEVYSNEYIDKFLNKSLLKKEDFKDDMISFLKEKDKKKYITIGELWAFPLILSLKIIDQMGDLSQKIYDMVNDRYEGKNLAISLDYNNINQEQFKNIKSLMDGKSDAYIQGALLYMHDNIVGYSEFVDEIKNNINTDFNKIISNNEDKERYLEDRISKLISCLRYLGDIEWKDIFLEISRVEGILCQDNIYNIMDFQSRDYYRQSIERISRKYNVDEYVIAQEALKLAKLSNCNDEKEYKSHIGYYIIDDGKPLLERSIGITKKHISLNNKSIIFILLNILITVVIATIITSIGGMDSIIQFLLLLIPCSEITSGILIFAASRILRPRFVPKIDYEKGIPKESKTTVVIPVIVNNCDKLKKYVDNMETFYLSNRGENIYFAILCDYFDSKTELSLYDKKIGDYGVDLVKRLNHKYGFKDDKFFFLCRKRIYNESDKVYMGWERKRGKLTEFMKLLRGSSDTSYDILSSNIKSLKNSKYIITLDADTVIPMGAAYRLIGAMSHPLNKVVRNNDGKVLRGYGIMQPRISVSIEDMNKTYFSKIFSDDAGLDIYTTAASDIYEDIFAEGSFTGKGIIDIDTYLNVLGDKIPENLVLSHDLLEGIYSRCALVTDVEFIDSYPSTYESSCKRIERWVRGDYQILPWLFNKDVSILGKWKIFDNIRRSLISPAIIAGIALNLLFWRNTLYWTTSFILQILFIMVFTVTDFVVTPMKGKKIKVRSLEQIILSISFLPNQCVLMIKSIFKSFYRMTISKRNLLEWKTSESSEDDKTDSLIEYFKLQYPAVIISLLYIIANFIRGYEFGILYLPLGLLWVCSPIISYLISKDRKKNKYNYTSEDIALLNDIAKRTWNYYDTFVNESNNYLAPDNYQEEPNNGEAHRTSPTNMGLSLMSDICAYDLGYIDKNSLIERIYNTIVSMDKLDKYEGNLYNWYDTRSMRPLYPRYVSTVDCGNLIGYLLIIKKSLSDITKKDNKVDKRYKDIIRIIDKFINESNLKALYDYDRGLFHIGLDVETGKLSSGYYDFLASECRVTSFISIMDGDIPYKHWFNLSRAKGRVFGSNVLSSWSGTMFEYLMPSLIMKDYDDTLLGNTYKKVVETQIKYGEKRDISWGISESAYYHFDASFNYQYKAFGVPGLGLKRGLEEELVVSPYSTVMAIEFSPFKSLKNLRELINKGMLGKYGFYDSVDCTRNRIPKSKKEAIVKTYMVHHNGMSLLALDNVLNNDIMKNRFHSIPQVRAYELLLKEKDIPSDVYDRESIPMDISHHYDENDITRRNINEIKDVNLLSNGNYNMIITGGGSGISTRNGMCINRWREDSSLEKGGIYIYIKNLNSNDYWSVSYEPVEEKGDSSHVYFEEEKTVFERTVGNIKSEEEVIVCSDEDGEIRRVTIYNNGSHSRTIEVTSYMEVTLAPYKADFLHPAFSNLFIHTDFDEQSKCLLATRRPRAKGQRKPFEAMCINVEGNMVGDIQYETDREKFIGRNRNLKSPKAMDNDTQMNYSKGAVLDPIMAMRVRVEIKPNDKAIVSFICMSSDSKEKAIDMCMKYKSNVSIQNAINHRVKYGLEMRHSQGIKSSTAAIYCSIASKVVFLQNNRDYKNTSVEDFVGNTRRLWSLGISGDLPIILFIVSEENIDILRNVIAMHKYWMNKSLKTDLIIYDNEESGYNMNIKNNVTNIVNSTSSRDLWNIPGGIYLVNKMNDDKNIIDFLIIMARLVIRDDSIFKQIIDEKSNISMEEKNIYESTLVNKNTYLNTDYDTSSLDFFNGYGGFRRDNGHYVIVLRNGDNTPSPWSNVLSNEKFGSVVTESGGGYTFAYNSREFKVSPWTNDWIKDNYDERLYIRINNKNEVFSIMRKPLTDSGEYVIEHGFGYTDFIHRYNDIYGKVRVYVPRNDSVKVLKISLKNLGKDKLSLSILYYMQLAMGTSYEENNNFIYTSIKDNRVILARNLSSPFFNDVYVFLSSFGGNESSFLGDRREFFGNSGEYEIPNCLNNKSLSNKDGFNDPCLSCMTDIDIYPEEQKEVYMVIGAEKGEEDVISAIDRFNDNELNNMFEDVYEWYRNLLGKITVSTPDKSMNYMMNGWLMYQTLACRFNARSAFYQSGGAIGFRDQLQDSLSICLFDEKITRKHILLCASRQYEEGDVQHWFHTIINSGIRTRFSDDLLWLPFITSKYIIRTGDYSVLDEVASYIKDDELGEGEDERYTERYEISNEGTIYEHCIKAIKRSLKYGSHGIPLMGSGDWNDGMNTVGNKGKGESVWLGWFLIDILGDFIIIANKKNDKESADYMQENRDKIIKNIEMNAWDGNWYRRAYFDDGTPLGSIENDECMIDSLSQSWSVISRGGSRERTEEAMNALNKNLVRKDIGIIRLLSPSFNNSNLEPGYIKGYIEGVRENGGQYTHAAVWAILAETKLNHGNTAMEYYRMINPINHALSNISSNIYKVEPYVISADVYSNKQHEGRGGWSWYTGASGWYYKIGLENILGYKKKDGKGFIINPCIPDEWNEYNISIKEDDYIYDIHVKKGKESSIIVDNKPYEKDMIYFEKGKHEVVVNIKANNN